MVLMTDFVTLTGSHRNIMSHNFTGAVVLVALRVPTLFESGLTPPLSFRPNVRVRLPDTKLQNAC